MLKMEISQNGRPLNSSTFDLSTIGYTNFDSEEEKRLSQMSFSAISDFGLDFDPLDVDWRVTEVIFGGNIQIIPAKLATVIPLSKFEPGNEISFTSKCLDPTKTAKKEDFIFKVHLEFFFKPYIRTSVVFS